MAAESENQTVARTPRWTIPVLLGAAALLLVTIVYSGLRGSKPVADANLSASAEAPTIEELTAATRTNPDDPKAWARLGAALFEAEDYPGAAAALDRATTLDPAQSNLWSLLGETRIYASPRDPMPPEAVAAFQRALALDPKDPVARYFMAVRKDVLKDHEGAIDDMLALLADTPPGAPWEADLRRTIEQIGKINGIETATRVAAIKPPAAPIAAAGSGLPGPTADQVRDAARIAPTNQDAMARGMVENLETRLKGDPRNIPGWIMLMRSRMTLNEPAKATRAYRDAVAANPGERDRLAQEARALGVPGI